MTSPGALAGITVVDLTRVLSGPYCTMTLADMGARVIKVEHPAGGDETRAWAPPFVEDQSAYFLGVNRNKESLTLDFKQADGLAVLRALVDRADVLIENFRPGALTRLGLGYETLRATHPRLVYCSISGFGQTGPRREQPGYDAVIQAEGGLMSVTGDPNGQPYRSGVAIADLVTGMLATQGVLLALFVRDRTGAGQLVDISMLDGVVSLLTHHATGYLATGMAPRRLGNGHATIAPYDIFAAADGDFFLAVGNDDQFRRFCRVAGLESLAADPDYATNPDRVVRRDALRARLEQALRARTRVAWIAALTDAGVPCGAVRSVPEVLADPQLQAREMIEAVEHVTAGPLRLLGVPVKLSATPGSVRTAPPTLGQHTDAILQELGYSDAAIRELRDRRVV
jgi:crotonobetainyl-CoA:carnitine CoA-transferase CaiB-like acyl-CoA transferase